MVSQKKAKIIGDRRWIRWLTVIVSLIGLVISLYAYYVEVRLEEDANYKPLCDLNEKIRCSTSLSSKYGVGFGFLGSVFGDSHTLNQRNTLYGAMFYILMAGLGFARNSKASLVQLNLAFISVLVSCYLGYNLFFNLKELCPVCIATYFVNVTILLLSIFKGKPRIAGPQDGLLKSSRSSDKEKTESPTKKSPTSAKGDSPSKSSYAQAVKANKKHQD